MTGPRIRTEDRTELETWEERQLSPEEFETRVRSPWSESEREQFDELVAWFSRRYPTAESRLAATRHLIAQYDRNE